ncbi:MAG: hypothetical protein GY941_28150 [Planctomycetes bacterium]|nr:hypothetical protein [Planctomycetota bacterium]
MIICKYIKPIYIAGFIFFAVLWPGVLKASPLAPPSPDVLQKKYLQGDLEERDQQCRKEVATPLGEECSFCHTAKAFTENGEKAKRMMVAAVSIGKKCSYCHNGKKKFTDKKDTAAKMFELSEMMGVECDFCHAGKDTLTSNGKTSKTAMILQEWAERGSKKCLKCHIEKKQFELNFHGWEVLTTQKGLLGL